MTWTRSTSPRPLGFVVTAASLLAASVAVASPTPEGIAFFESKIRPVLAAHCYSCHSAEALRAGKLKAALLVDTRAGMQKGGESGAAVVPGKRDDSLLLAALKYDGFEMPPAGKLPDQVIADFERWIDMGAPDPRDEPLAAIDERTIDVAAGRNHWSYRRLAPVAVPEVGASQAAWPRNEIDRFVLAKQEAAGIAPSPEASRARLARRVFFDLTGLPPSPEELATFLADESPDAYEKLVDRLLASPRFGERWARHWLDTVRYAESSGYEFDADRGSAFHYRDWVIDAVNADMPYDEFLRLQVAGDLVKPGDYEATRATGFLVAGPYPGQVTAKTVEPIRYDQLDDMVATLGSSVLGMTIGCARCHDHKYDAIGHRDYYAMIACLGKAVQRDTGIDRDPEGTRQNREAWQAERQPIAAAVARFEAEMMPARLARWLAGPAISGQSAPWQVLDPQAAKATKATLVEEPGDVVSASGRLEGDEFYTLTFRTRQQGITALKIDALASPSAPGGGPGTGKDGKFRLTGMRVFAAPLVPAADRKTVAPVLKAVAATFEEKGFELGGAVDADSFTGWSVGGQAGRDHAAVIGFDKPVGFEGGTLLTVELRFQSKQHGLARFRLSATDATGPIDMLAPAAPQAAREIAMLWDKAAGADGAIADQAAARELLGWLRRFDAVAEQVLAPLDAVDAREPKPNLTQVYATINGPWVITGNSQGVTSGSQDVFVLARGEVGRKKGKAAPGFVLATIASDEAESQLFATAATETAVEPRLGLANFLTDVNRGAGPLAARTIVNRLWHHHFGHGIVATPNDLGTQGDPPSHPELLEWLAGRLVDEKWSLKAIHRLIVTSATYRQSGEVREAARAIDPDNRLLWHRRPTRLEGEVIRDALLAVSGRLESTMHGPSFVDVSKPRRSIYMRVKRSEPDAFLRVFDQPEPVQSVGARGIATVPTQALAMMNSPLVRQAAEGLAARVRTMSGRATEPAADTAAEIDRIFLTALSRDPSAAERERFATFLDARRQAAGAEEPRRATALVDTCQLVLCLNEFIYVD
jgi:hypothetical protein